MRGATGITLQPHQVLRQPRKMNLMIDPLLRLPRKMNAMIDRAHL